MNKSKIDTLLIIRGIIAVAVVVWHITADSNTIPPMINIPGRTAVWFFFGISGYVISYGFFTERYQYNAKGLKTFYLNRFLRIYPLFLLLSFLTMATEYAISGKLLISISDIPSQLLMLQFNHSYILNSVFWTLGIEVQFYFLVPLLTWLCMRRRKYVLLVGFYILSLAWLPFAYYSFGLSFDGRNLLSNLSHFLIGIIACRLTLGKQLPKLNLFFLIGVIILIILCTNCLYAYAIKYYWTLGSVMIDAAIFIAVYLHAIVKETEITKNIFLKIFSFLGLISYGVYAWHPYLIKYIPFLDNNIPLTVGATILVAYLVYTFVERPILRLKK